jgi:hypothetical protein
MERHGSESYFVIGEGLLTESDGGRQLAAAATPQFRFSRMGPKGEQLGRANRVKLGRAMTRGGGGSSAIPAGYTYLGQFVDHDLTFDKTKVTLGTNIAPIDLLQGRSPAVDLDSLYGAGPGDPKSAPFYKDDRHLKMGRTSKTGPDDAKDGFDLPRVGTGSFDEKRKALIPDHRNDENLAVAQTHLAMIRFHNRVVDTALPGGTPAAQRFRKARELAVKHYQWMLRHDYLPRICDPAVVDDVFTNGRKAFEVGVTPTDIPTMPIEFSVAAFRLGHSMIRQDYNWNARFPDHAGALFFLFDFSGTSGSPPLGGFPRLPSNWIADWRRLYDFKGEAGRNDLAAPIRLNKAMRIDTNLVDPLRNLPTGSFGGPEVPFDDPRANLAFRNLTRAKMVKLATGQKFQAFLKTKGVNVAKLTAAQIRNGDDGASLANLTQTQRQGVVAKTPLWFYILREAEVGGGRLKGVGARIVAETFHRAMEGSKHSIVRDTAFRPSLGPDSNTFRMVDLLLFAFEGKKGLLAPLGD